MISRAGGLARPRDCLARWRHLSSWNSKLVHPLVLVVVVSLAMAWPLFQYGFPPSNSDGAIHVRWLHHAANQFWNGEIYPRYFPGLNEEFGSPSFFIYPPLSTAAGALFWRLAPEQERDWYALGWGSALGLVLSGLFMWQFLRRSLGDPWAAAVGSILYVTAPYHLGIDLFDRGANAEFWAFAFMPLVLLSFHRLVDATGEQPLSCDCLRTAIIQFLRDLVLPPGPVLVAGISLAALFYCHVLTALTFAPVALGYACFLGRAALVRSIAAGIWAVLLSAAYLFTAALYSGYTVGSDSSLFTGKFIATTCFFPGFNWKSPWPEDSPFCRRLFWAFAGQVFLQGICTVVLLRGKMAPAERRTMRTWIFALYFCLLMMLPIAEPLYNLFSPFQRLQFAWRFLSPATFVSCVLMAILWKSMRSHRVLSGVALAGWLATALWINGTLYLDNHRKAQGQLRTELRALDFNERDAFGEYVPAGANLFGAEEIFKARTNANSRSVLALSGVGEVLVEYVTPRRVILDCKATNEFRFVLHQFFFPGWEASDVATGRAVPIFKQSPSGLMEIAVPEGTSRVELRLSPLGPERAGIGVALFSAGWLAVVGMGRCFVRRKRKTRHSAAFAGMGKAGL